jgi:hypothetical protein
MSSMARDQQIDGRSTSFAKLYARVGPVAAALLGLLWLFVSVTHLVADPTRWGYYLMFLLGVLAVVMAAHPVGRTALSWPLPALETDEEVIIQERASWVAGVARGGTLVITGRRVIFEPNSVEAVLGLSRHAWSRSAIATVALAPRGLNLLGGAVRRRVRLTMLDGSTELFVVNRPQELEDRLAELIGPSP